MELWGITHLVRKQNLGEKNNILPTDMDTFVSGIYFWTIVSQCVHRKFLLLEYGPGLKQ